MEAIKADTDELLKPVKDAGNFFKRVTGKEVTAPILSKERIMMDERIGSFREKKAEKKEQVKQEKKEQSKQKRKAFFGKIRSKSLERKLLQGAKKYTQTDETTDVKQLPAQTDENGDNE